MATLTTNIGLTKPSTTDFYDIAVQNNNMDLIDTALHLGWDFYATSGETFGVNCTYEEGYATFEVLLDSKSTNSGSTDTISVPSGYNYIKCTITGTAERTTFGDTEALLYLDGTAYSFSNIRPGSATTNTPYHSTLLLPLSGDASTVKIYIEGESGNNDMSVVKITDVTLTTY